MPVGWSGSDPAEVADGSSYELGTEYVANETITITHIRVHTGAGEIGQAGRRARLWTAAGAELAQTAATTDLPTGWAELELTTPVTRTAGQRFVVSYSTYGNYSALNSALTADKPSADGAVTALSSANATNGNGVFAVGAPGTFPTTPSGGSTFYGVDLVYTLGAGGNTAPTITAFEVEVIGATAEATITVTDEETLAGATYRIDWGDGTSSTGSASAQHTYTVTGLYPVAAIVTDSGGLYDYATAAVSAYVPPVGPLLTTSRYPQTVDRVVHLLRTAGLQVWDGPIMTGDRGDAVFVGYDAVPDGEFRSAEMNQQWAEAVGARRRDETFDIQCAALASVGENDPKLGRDRAFALLAVVETTLRADPSLGITPTPFVAEFAPTAVFTEPDGAGLQVRVPFLIRVSTRI